VADITPLQSAMQKIEAAKHGFFKNAKTMTEAHVRFTSSEVLALSTELRYMVTVRKAVAIAATIIEQETTTRP
jgi:hypothetical protein